MPSGVAKWRAGLKLVLSRELTQQEKNELKALIRRKATLCLLWFDSIIGLFVMLYFLSPLVGMQDGTSVRTYSDIISIILPMYTAIALVFTFLNFSRMFTLKRDLSRNQMESYEGHFDEAVLKLRTVSSLIRNGLFFPATDNPQKMNVLPLSGLIWSVNGIQQRIWLRVFGVETAEEPSYAAIAADWVQPLNPKRKDLAYVNYRQMTTDEKSELIHYIRSHLQKSIWLPLLINLWCFGWLYKLIFVTRSFSPLSWIVLALSILWDIARLSRLKMYLKLREDVRKGILVIARMPQKVEIASESLVPDMTSRTEFLPISRYLWSKEGVPAAWRIASIR